VDVSSLVSISGSKSVSCWLSWAYASGVKNSAQGVEVCEYTYLAGKLTIWEYWAPVLLPCSMGVTPLVLEVYFRDHTKSLDDPFIEVWSEITNCHSDFCTGSTFQICSPISHISITWPLYQLIHDNSQTKHEYDVSHLWISTGHIVSNLPGYSSSAGKLIPGHQPNDSFLMLHWFIPREMRCLQYQTTMASWDMQGRTRDESLTIDWNIRDLWTDWTYTSQRWVRPHSLCLGEWDWGFICPEWHGILSVRYMAKLLTCRSLYIWLENSVLKLHVLSVAAIVKPSCTRWVYVRALSLVLGDRTLFAVNWLQISSYSYKVSPIAIMSQCKHNTLMT